MIAPLAKLLDWLAIQLVWGRRARSLLKLGANPRLEEAIQFLKSPDFIPAQSAPAQLEFDQSGRHFRFPTPRPGRFAENNTVYGRLYRSAKCWQERPVIILLHGAGGTDYHLEFPFMARCCNRAGFNAAMLLAPFQFQRRPRQLAGLSWPDYRLDAEIGYAQAVAEIRALIGWLLGEGCPSVALFGVSFGAWLAGMAATRDSRLKAIALVAPRVRSDYPATRGEGILWTPLRKALERRKAALEAWDTTPTNLTLSQPVIPKDNILLIQGLYDLCAVPEYTEELRQKWEQPEIWRLPHGHVSLMGVPGLTNRVLCWLAPRVNVHPCSVANHPLEIG